MKLVRHICRYVLMATGVFLAGSALSQTTDRDALAATLRERLANMSPEEKQKLREQVRSQWQQLSPADQASLQQKLSELQNMSPAERQKLRSDLQQAFSEGRLPLAK